jgi:hypothetical protein
MLSSQAGDGYVDTYTPSIGHDACAAPSIRWIEPLVIAAPAAPMPERRRPAGHRRRCRTRHRPGRLSGTAGPSQQCRSGWRCRPDLRRRYTHRRACHGETRSGDLRRFVSIAARRSLALPYRMAAASGTSCSGCAPFQGRARPEHCGSRRPLGQEVSRAVARTTSPSACHIATGPIAPPGLPPAKALGRRLRPCWQGTTPAPQARCDR